MTRRLVSLLLCVIPVLVWVQGSDRARTLHQDAFVFDAHIHVVDRQFYHGGDMGQRVDDGQFDLVRAKEGGLDAMFFSLFVTEQYYPARMETKQVLRLIDAAYDQLGKNKDKIELAFNASDIERISRTGKIAALMDLEGGFDLTTMTRYRADFDCPVAFAEQDVSGTMAELLAQRGLRQLHVAETEKYAHVTYFFNGGREDEWQGETRILIPSPRDVPSYDQKPEMSAREVSRRFCEEVGDGYAFAIVNFANPDMVGHTGSIPAVTRAIETVDSCLGDILQAVERVGGVSLITADHGNAEQMLEPDGVSPHTAHTTNPVPLVVTTDTGLENGELADLIPTALELLGLEKSPEMSGKSLVKW